MDFALALEISALVAVGFELLKRLLARYFPAATGEYIIRALLVVVALAAASAYHFYFSGHPEILKTVTQITVQASGIWAFIIRLIVRKPTPSPLSAAETTEREAQ